VPGAELFVKADVELRSFGPLEARPLAESLIEATSGKRDRSRCSPNCPGPRLNGSLSALPLRIEVLPHECHGTCAVAQH